MSTWNPDALRAISDAEELSLTAAHPDNSFRKPVVIWVVRHGNDLYIRAFKGASGAWFRGTTQSGWGRIRAGGIEQEVNVVPESDPVINDALDAAYRSKYRRYPTYVAPMITPEARATTLKLVPRT